MAPSELMMANGADAAAKTPALEVAEARELALPFAALSEVLNDPHRHPEWVPALRAIEALPDGTWRAHLGYLSFRRAIVFEQLAGDPDSVAWRGTDAEVTVELGLTVTLRSSSRVLVRFHGRLQSADGFLGLQIDHPLVRVSLSLAVQDSLSRLEKLVQSRGLELRRDSCDVETAPRVRAA